MNADHGAAAADYLSARMAPLDLANPDLSRESLSPQAEVALLARMLYREGYNDHLAGHITYRQPDGTLLATPLVLAWDELRASDIIRMDMDGRVVEGRWIVSPAIALHIELYKMRPEVRVAVHHHPEYTTVWAAAGEKPPIYDQGSAIESDDGVTVYADYEGDVTDPLIARKNVEAMGDAHAALLANHGVLVVADSIERAQYTMRNDRMAKSSGLASARAGARSRRADGRRSGRWVGSHPRQPGRLAVPIRTCDTPRTPAPIRQCSTRRSSRHVCRTVATVGRAVTSPNRNLARTFVITTGGKRSGNGSLCVFQRVAG